MAARGSAAKSVTGASMSKYDVEVEARLQALEAAVAELKNHEHAAAPAAPAAGGEDALLRKIVRAMEPNFDHLAKKFGE
tara:strand:- start:882 stop:1118 length:237 start_codon:yes stop_codon:yes gene_type:complete